MTTPVFRKVGQCFRAAVPRLQSRYRERGSHVDPGGAAVVRSDAQPSPLLGSSGTVSTNAPDAVGAYVLAYGHLQVGHRPC